MKNLLTNKAVWVGLVALIIAGFFYFRSRSAADSKETPIVPNKDEVASPRISTIKDEITLSGSIDALTKTDIRFSTSGRLAWVGVKEGDRVKKWQSLASLDKAELKKNLEKDFNTYRSALSTFDDTQDKYKTEKDNLTLTGEMKRILVRSQNTLNNSVIDYELTDLSIKYATIFSPISGIVTKIDQPIAGVNITPATSGFTVIDPASIYFKSEVEQDEISKIKIGQPASIEFDSYPDELVNGSITQISFSPIPGRTTPTYLVNIGFDSDNNDLKYRLGMDGDANIALSESKETLVVPYDAIVEEEDKKFVYVKKLNANTAQKVEVETGIETATEVEITKGISINDQIVIKAK